MIVVVTVLALTSLGKKDFKATASSSSSPLVQVSGPSPVTPGSPAGCQIATIDGSDNKNTENEVSMAVDPNNKDHIVGVWSQDFYSGIMVGVSNDGGQTWSKKLVPNVSVCSGSSNSDQQMSANNWISFAPNGDLHLIVMGLGMPPFQGYSDIMTLKSTDGGETWGQPKRLVYDETGKSSGVKTYDKPSIAVDPSDSNIVYATWDSNRTAPSSGEHALTIAISRDAGETWSQPKDIYSTPTSGWNWANGAKFVFTPSGRVMLFWNRSQYTKKAGSLFQVGGQGHVEQVVYVYSDNKGATWGPVSNKVEPVIAVQAQSRKVYDSNGVDVYNPDSCVTIKKKTSCTTWAEAPVFYDVEVDKNNGNIYLAWTDARLSNGGNFSDLSQVHNDILLSVSTDGGSTWGAPTKINQAPTSIAQGYQQAMLPDIAVADNGTVGVAYYDFRNDTVGDGWMADYWMVRCNPASGSCASNNNWQESRLTDQSFDMTGAMWRYTYFLGDYQGVQAAGNDFVTMFTVPEVSDKGNIYFRRVTE